jgi:DNA-binding MarR family transcriptional regulator
MTDSLKPAPFPSVTSSHLTDGMEPDIHISYQIMKVANLMAFGGSSRNVRRFGLNVGEWRVVSMLGRTGPITAAQIVDFLAQDKANVSRSIAGLSKKGLVAKIPNPKHKRSPYIWMSNAGMKLCDEIIPVFSEQVEMFCASLTEKEKTTLCRLLDKLKAQTTEVRQKEGL